MSRNLPARDMLSSGQTWDNMRMEQMIQTLREIGICAETIAAIESADDEKQARECALLLIAMYDDRHEYLAEI